MTWSLEDVPAFRAVVDHGGITGAARALGWPKSSVSKAVTRLEAGLGVRLLERNSRAVRVTVEGQTFYRQCLLILEQVEATTAIMSGLTAAPSGKLLVALPPAFCQEILAPHLPEFRRRHPRVELELLSTSRRVDFLRERIDVAVVVGPQADSDLVQRTLQAGRLIWIASPDYVKELKPGSSVADLAPHVWIVEDRYASEPLAVRVDGEAATLDFRRQAIRVNDPLAVREAVSRGAGISFLPERYCTNHLASGALVEVARHIEFDTGASVLSVVFSSRHLVSARVRVFVDFLFETCRGPQIQAKALDKV